MDIDYPTTLQRRIEQMIVDGQYGRGIALTISELAARHQSPPDQIEQVMLAICRKGLADREAHGSDAFRVLGLPTTDLASVFTHTAAAGLKPRSLVRDVEIEPATPEVAGKLKVEIASPVYRYVRTRYVGEQALANQTNYMPFAICPGLEHDDVSRYSFQKLLEEKYLAVLMDMREEFRLVPATNEDQEILGLPHRALVLVVERIALGATGWPLVWANIRIRPDRYEYVSALWPQAARLLKDKDS